MAAVPSGSKPPHAHSSVKTVLAVGANNVGWMAPMMSTFFAGCSVPSSSRRQLRLGWTSAAVEDVPEVESGFAFLPHTCEGHQSGGSGLATSATSPLGFVALVVVVAAVVVLVVRVSVPWLLNQRQHLH